MLLLFVVCGRCIFLNGHANLARQKSGKLHSRRGPSNSFPNCIHSLVLSSNQIM